MVTLERGLQIAELAALAQALDRVDMTVLRLDGQHQTGAGCHAVHAYRAGAAHAVLAAKMSTCCAQLVPNEIAQKHARVGLAYTFFAVQSQTHPTRGVRRDTGHGFASINSLCPCSRTSWRR